MKKHTEVIVSINVFQSVETLLLQLRTMHENLKLAHVVILNCSDSFYDVLKTKVLPNNVYLNPQRINKKKLHGSLTKGIVSNMVYALQFFDFKYFIILSGRTIFYRQLTSVSDLERLQKKWTSLQERKVRMVGPPPENVWHWQSFKQTLLAQHYLKLGYTLHASAHEGLVFSGQVCRNVVSFLLQHKVIACNLFEHAWCVEEFGLQTIASNECNAQNLQYGFIYIGNGVDEEVDFTAKDKYTRKIAYL
jgi:hypothetical protein